MRKEYRQRAKTKVKVETVRVRNTKALPERAQSVAKNLEAMNAVFGYLFGDENFITLLEAESLTALPRYLQPLYEEARDGHEIRK
jgi:hypothetical protein